jgi:hypothetical protein
MNKHQLMRLQLPLKKLKLLLPKRLHQNNKLNKPLPKQQKLLLMQNKEQADTYPNSLGLCAISQAEKPISKIICLPSTDRGTLKVSSALLIASATATTLVANDFAEGEQNFVKLAEGLTEVAEEKTKIEEAPENVAEAAQTLVQASTQDSEEVGEEAKADSRDETASDGEEANGETYDAVKDMDIFM